MTCFLLERSLYPYWFLHSSSVSHFWFLFGFNSWARFYSCLCSFRRVFVSKIPVSFRYLCTNLMDLFNTSSFVSVSKASVSWNVEFCILDIKKCQHNPFSEFGLPARTWLFLLLVLREMLQESHFHLYYAWIVISFRESRFLLVVDTVFFLQPLAFFHYLAGRLLSLSCLSIALPVSP